MKLLLIHDGHPLAATLPGAVAGEVRTAGWEERPTEAPTVDGLVFAPPPWTQEPDSVDVVLDDLEVSYRWLHAWVPYAREHGGGVVLYVLQLDGVCGSADNVLLAERDSAFLAQARAMAMELGRFGIRSNALAVGPLAGAAPEPPEAELTANPLRRVGTWQEAAEAAAFLLGSGARHVTGQLLVCAGGADVGRIVP